MTLPVLLRIRNAPHLRPPTCGHIFPICTHILWSTSGAPIEFSRRTSMPYSLLVNFCQVLWNDLVIKRQRTWLPEYWFGWFT